MTQRYGFYLNLDSCVGCKACQIACKDKNNLAVDMLWRRVAEITGGGWLPSGGNAWIATTFTYFVSTACYHCEQPICKEVCPTTAIRQRADGIVFIDGERCVGCGYCKWACPYDAPQFDTQTGVMTKCNFCYDNLDAGKPPACVSACQMRVLDFGDLDTLRAKHGTANTVYPLPSDAALTCPAVVFTPHHHAVTGNTAAAHIANREEI